MKVCCCIPRGDVEMSVEADKGAYFVGETAHIEVNVDNRSKSEVSNTPPYYTGAWL